MTSRLKKIKQIWRSVSGISLRNGPAGSQDRTTLFWNQLYSRYMDDLPWLQEDLLSPNLDFINNVCPLNVNQKFRAVDLGCATGKLTANLHSLLTANLHSLTGWEVDGIDISAIAIGLAQNNFPHLNFQTADVRSLPFSAQTFDLVFDRSLYQHMYQVSDQVKYHQEVIRILKDGGYYILNTFIYSPEGENIQRLMEKILLRKVKLFYQQDLIERFSGNFELIDIKSQKVLNPLSFRLKMWPFTYLKIRLTFLCLLMKKKTLSESTHEQ